MLSGKSSFNKDPAANQVLIKIHVSGIRYTEVHSTIGHEPVDVSEYLGICIFSLHTASQDGQYAKKRFDIWSDIESRA